MARMTRRSIVAGSLVTVVSGVVRGAGAAPRRRSKAAQVPTPETKKLLENEFLVLPQNPIVGGNAVPVGIKIPSAWLKKVNANSTVTAELHWNDKSIVVFTLGKLAIGDRDHDVKFATRIKIPTDMPKGIPPTDTLRGKLSVEVIPDAHADLTAPQSVDLEISQCDDCSTVNHGQVVLATQPAPFTKGKAVAVKSYVPVSVPVLRALKRIDCLFGRSSAQQLQPPGESLSEYELIRADVTTASLLSDEVFLAVDVPLSDNGLLEMFWTYNDGKNLRASAYLTQAV